MSVTAGTLHGKVVLSLLRLVGCVINGVVVVVRTPESPRWLSLRDADVVASVVSRPVTIVTVFILHYSRVSPADRSYIAFNDSGHISCSLPSSLHFLTMSGWKCIFYCVEIIVKK